MSLEELTVLANEEASRAGIPLPHDPRRRAPRKGTVRIESTETGPAKWCICHAFSAIKKHCRVPSFPAGDLEEKKHWLVGHELYLSLDMHPGYFAIPMRESDVGKTTFQVEGKGFYGYTRMPFGLTRAPVTFQELMALLFAELFMRYLENHMDNLGAAAPTFEVLLERFEEILILAQGAKMSLAPLKAKTGVHRLLFGGSIIDRDGIHPETAKVASILQYLRPTTTIAVL
jgi:hypothetical protein